MTRKKKPLVPGDFGELMSMPSPWLGGEGPHSDMVLSTRIRLARNLASVPFTHRAREEQLQGVMLSVSGAVQRSGAFGDGLLLRLNEMTPVQRQVLVERHLVSHEMGDGARPRGLAIGRDQRLSMMINE
jgi:protein arginine kinase